MKQTDYSSNAPHLAAQLNEQLAMAGYVPVARHGDDKLPDMPGHFTCSEYWRLDNPSMRAIVTFDLAHDSRLSVTCKQVPKMSMMHRLLDSFRSKADLLPDEVISAQDLVDGTKTIPGANLVSEPHQRLALALHKNVRPIFFVDPLHSSDSVLALNAHMSGDIHKISAAAGPAPQDEDARIKRLGEVGAQQLLSTSIVTLHVPLKGRDILSMTARRLVMRSYQSQPQLVSFDRFAAHHAVLMDQHARYCQSSRAIQVFPPGR